MKPPPFRYHRATSVADALDALAHHGPEAMLLAGGQSLVPMLNLRLAAPTALVDLFHVDELRFIEVTDDAVRIGATTTQHALETAPPARLGGLAVLADAARLVGHHPIRTRGTIGGSIAHADPAAEMPVLAVLLGAEVVLAGAGGGRRAVPAQDFFLGYLQTARRADEIVVEVRVPRRLPRAVLAEHARRHGDFGLVVAGVALEERDGRCSEIRIVCGGVAGVPVRLREVEESLIGRRLTAPVVEAACRRAGAAVSPPTDLHATGAYRRALTAGLVARCLRRLRPDAEVAR